MGAYKNAWMKAYRERNQELIRAQDRAKYWANREQRIAANKAWHLAHPDYQHDWHLKNRDKNRDKSQARAKARYVQNRDEQLAANREYHRVNREAINARYRKRYQDAASGLRLYNLKRQHERHALGTIDVDWLAILLRDPCSYCGGKGGEVDHILPIVRGGTNDWNNLTAACRKCNARKKDRLLLTFVLEKTGRE